MMKSLVLKAPHEMALEYRDIPVPGPLDVMIRVKAASICHTDFLPINGEYPGCKYPTVLGHEFSGVVEQCGQSVKHVKPGDHVACLGSNYCGVCPNCLRGLHNGCANAHYIPFDMDGAYQEMVCIPNQMVYTFDESLSFAEAALIEPAANGYSAVERANIYPGEHAVIIGPGPIGLLALQSARIKCPATLMVLGTRVERLKLAAKLGATHTINIRNVNPYDAVMDITNGLGADAVILCAGTEDAWNLAGRIMAPYGRVVIEALPPVANARWSVTMLDFTGKHLSYLGVSGYTGSQFKTAMMLIQLQKIDVSSLITHRFTLEEYEEAFETSDKRKGGAIKVVFEMGK